MQSAKMSLCFVTKIHFDSAFLTMGHRNCEPDYDPWMTSVFQSLFFCCCVVVLLLR